jgi:type II secretory pathway pseudopilin PulG
MRNATCTGNVCDRGWRRRFLPASSHRPSAAAGFTILEIVIVLAIVVLLVAAATPEISSMLLAEKLKAPARELEAMAITARCNALAEQRPYQIVLKQDGFRLERLGEGKDSGLVSEYTMSKDVAFELASWPQEKWSRPKRHIWYFPPTGLCEPIRVMFRKGESYFMQRYSAVTGWDQEETFFIR